MFVHIVLFKVKAQVLNNGFEEFKARIESLRDLQVTKEEVTDLKFGPPVWDSRSHGFNYGLYAVFRTKEGLVRYKEDSNHKECVAKVLPLTSAFLRWCFCRTAMVRTRAITNAHTDLLAYDFEI